MTPTRRWPGPSWVRFALTALGAITIGFVAGRRYPFERLQELISTEASLPASWSRFPAGPGPRYEPTVARVGRAVFVMGGFVDNELNAGVDVFRWASGRWTRMSDMPGPITHRTAAVVGDTVWVAGGFVGQHPGPTTDEVWAYDTATDRWSRGPSIPEPRGGGLLVAVDRQLHYVGGYAANRNDHAADHWVLPVDVATGLRTWTEAAPLPSPRGHLSGAVLDGFVFAIGGTKRHDPAQVDVFDVHRYDPSTDRWTDIKRLPRPRSHAEPSTFVHNGLIYVIGGRSRPAYRQQLAEVSVYHPSLDRWLAAQPLPAPRMAPMAVALGDSIVVGLGAIDTEERTDAIWVTLDRPGWWRGAPMPVPLGEVAAGVLGDYLLVVGQGSEATLGLDLGTGEWAPIERFARRPALGDHHAAQIIDGQLYLVGGFGAAAGITQVFDLARNEWRFGPDPPFAAGASASAVIDGRLYLAGGIADDTTVGNLARLDPVTETWTRLAPMPLPRNHAAAATDGRRLFLFGGRGPGSGPGNTVANGFDQVQVYDPSTARWIVSGDSGGPPPLPIGRGGMGTAVFADGLFFVIGGETRSGPGATAAGVYDRTDIYDPATREWRRGPPLPTARHGVFPVALGDNIYVAGGGTRAGRSASSVLEVLRRDPRSDGRR